MALARRDQPIEDIWRELVEGLVMIFETRDRVPPQRYMELYTLVFNFCTKNREDEQFTQPVARIGRRAGVGNNRNGGAIGAEFVGAELYERLKEFITTFAKRLLEVGAS
jgi:cullin 1